MNTSEKIKKELQELVTSQKELLRLAKDDKDTIAFGLEYQAWYSRAYKLVESLAPERLDEFIGYYLINAKRKDMNSTNYVIQDYIKGVRPRDNSMGIPFWDANSIARGRIINQVQILASLSSRIESVLHDVTGYLFAEIQDTELLAATKLKKISKRAAGALAGVVLERHLQRVAINHKITIGKKNPTIADINDPLKNKEVYDTPVWRKIQLLADLRNICSHQKSMEPTEEQVDELISGVNSIIKSIF